jgi:hypothetical protein
MVRLSLVFASALLFCLPLQAQEMPGPREGAINSSGSGQLKVVTYEVMNAQATVMMLPGGSWNIGSIDPTSGMLTGTNFFIRTIPMFLAQKFNVVTMHRPENVESLRDAVLRSGQQHGQDVISLSNYALNLGKPVWLLGTSMGAISALNAVTLEKETKVSGIVISSAVANKTSSVKAGALDFPLEEIRVPVYVSGHAKDECRSTPPATTREIAKRLVKSKKVELKMTESGSSPSGNPCGPTHWHGYINAEQEVVRQMSEFIREN